MPEEALGKAQFFSENDHQVNGLVCKILLYLMGIFPILVLLVALKVVDMSYRDLLILISIGCFCCITPFIVYKKSASIQFVKYYGIIAISVFIALLGVNVSIEDDMLFILGVALSCMYLDYRFTRQIGIIGYVLMILSLFIKAGQMALIRGETPLQWFIGYGLGFSIQYIVLLIVFMGLSKKTKILLEKLREKDQIQRVVENCEEISRHLVDVVGEVTRSMEVSGENNELIANLTQKTLSDCYSNLSYMNETEKSIDEMCKALEEIHIETREVQRTSEETYKGTEEYKILITHTVERMREIEETTKITREAVEALEMRFREITSFTEIIASITSKTNILAINASIEAARAGEKGKGFDIVAKEVGKLATASKEATECIRELIEKLTVEVKGTEKSVARSEASVRKGILSMIEAKEKVQGLGGLQVKAKVQVEKITAHCEASKNYGEGVVRKAEQINYLMHQSVEQAHAISESTHSQVELTKQIEKNFEQINVISKELLEISQLS